MVSQRVNIKESGKIKKHQDLARELFKLWNMKVIIMLITGGALGMLSKMPISRSDELEICGRFETVQTLALFGSARIV